MARQSVDRVALARRIGRAEAVVQERERLRPLLERAEGVLAGRIVTLADRAEVLLALRAELGKE